MKTYEKTEEFVHLLHSELKTRYRPTAGALISVVMARDEHRGAKEERWFLVGGRALFSDSSLEARPAGTYPAIALFEEWLDGQENAVARIEQILSGRGIILGTPVTANFRYTEQLEGAWIRQFTPWSEAHFRSEPVIENGNRPALTPNPVTKFGHPPYENGASAAAYWLQPMQRFSKRQSDYGNIGSFLTVIPDTRGRIAEANWEKSALNVTVEANVPVQDMQLQCMFFETEERRYSVHEVSMTATQVEVPSDAQGVTVYLLHASGSLLDQAALSVVDRAFIQDAAKLPMDVQAEADLQAGEGDEVEFKPFIRPMDEKWSEITETVVAFANTRGGRLYLGVDDHRRLEGASMLSRALGTKYDVAKADLERGVNKLLTDKIKPVPKFAVRFFELHGEPVCCVAVERGHQRPYATFNNEIFIRKGSTNANPDPTTELRALMQDEVIRTVGGAVWGS